MEWMTTIVLFGAILISVQKRRKKMMWRSQHKTGALTKALSQLVGTAGGIYLSIELLLTFLGIPEELYNPPSVTYIKPLALLALVIAIFQPYLEDLLTKITRGRQL